MKFCLPKINRMVFALGRLFYFLYPLFHKWKSVKVFFYSGLICRNFKSFGHNSIIGFPARLIIGEKYISIGDDCFIGSKSQITAWDRFKGQKFTPQIHIGNNCSIGDQAHITCINLVQIGNNVLTGKRILITDNSHGESKIYNLNIPPINRELFSKGPVIIKDNVWIGENVCILSGVTVGTGAIIGANSVVTKDVPDFCIACGNPAIIVKRIE